MIRLIVALAILVGGHQAAGAQGADPPAVPPSNAAEDTNAPTCVNLNAASPSELVTLSGIGPTRAEAIVKAREKRRFRRTEDLLRVPGIGRKTWGRIRHRLCVE